MRTRDRLVQATGLLLIVIIGLVFYGGKNAISGIIFSGEEKRSEGAGSVEIMNEPQDVKVFSNGIVWDLGVKKAPNESAGGNCFWLLSSEFIALGASQDSHLMNVRLSDIEGRVHGKAFSGPPKIAASGVLDNCGASAIVVDQERDRQWGFGRHRRGDVGVVDIKRRAPTGFINNEISGREMRGIGQVQLAFQRTPLQATKASQDNSEDTNHARCYGRCPSRPILAGIFFLVGAASMGLAIYTAIWWRCGSIVFVAYVIAWIAIAQATSLFLAGKWFSSP